MNIKKIINEVIQNYDGDELDNNITRKALKYKFDDELELTKPMIINQNKVKHELLQYLVGLGLYKNPDFNISYNKDNNFEPGYSDRLGSIIIPDFIPEFRKYVLNLYHNTSDQNWDNTFNIFKNNVQKILTKYGLELTDGNQFQYKYGDLLISLKTPENIEYANKFQRYVLHNPHKLMTTKEFIGTSDKRNEKRKFFKYSVDGIEYKFLLNPSKEDMYFGTGNSSIFGGIFGKAIDSFGGRNTIEYENVILQITYNFRVLNFIVGGDGFYSLSDVEKFKKDENFNIKPIDMNNNRYVNGLPNKLNDLKNLYEKLNSSKIKMIVFLTLGGDLSSTKNGGLLDKKDNVVYYPYILT